MALDVEQVTAVVFVFGVPEMVEARTKHVGQGSKRTDMAAQIAAIGGVVAIGLDHHGHGVPTHISAKTFFNFNIAWAALFLVGLQGIDITRVGRKRHVDAVFSGVLQQLLQ